MEIKKARPRENKPPKGSDNLTPEDILLRQSDWHYCRNTDGTIRTVLDPQKASMFGLDFKVAPDIVMPLFDFGVIRPLGVPYNVREAEMRQSLWRSDPSVSYYFN